MDTLASPPSTTDGISATSAHLASGAPIRSATTGAARTPPTLSVVVTARLAARIPPIRRSSMTLRRMMAASNPQVLARLANVSTAIANAAMPKSLGVSSRARTTVARTLSSCWESWSSPRHLAAESTSDRMTSEFDDSASVAVGLAG